MARTPNKSLSRSQFKELHGKLTDPDDGGFSIHATTGAVPDKGFMVSEHGSEELIPNDSYKASRLVRFVRRNREALQDSNLFFGGWKEPASVSLDRSRQFHDEAKAGVETIHQNQKAMYDVGGKTDIGNPYYDPGLRKKADIEREWDKKYGR